MKTSRALALLAVLFVLAMGTARGQGSIYYSDQEIDWSRLGDYERLSQGMGFEDYVVDGDHGRTYFRVAARQSVYKDALSVEGGTRHQWGEEISIQVSLPAERFLAPDAVDDGSGSRQPFWLSVVAVGSPVRGGSLRREDQIEEFRLSAPEMTLRLSDLEHVLARMYPGSYEVRLQTAVSQQTGSFIVARKRIVITVNQEKGSLKRVPSPRRGEVSVVADVKSLLEGWIYTFDWAQITRDGHRRRLAGSQYNEIVPGRPTVVGAATQPGVYTIDLLITDRAKRRAYVVDTLIVAISAAASQASTGGLLLTFDGESVNNPTPTPIEIHQGEEVPIEFSVSQQTSFRLPGDVVVELYAMPSNELEEKWEIGRKKKASWRYKVEAKPGNYEVRLSVSVFGQSSAGFLRRRVRVLPTGGVRLVLDSQRVEVGEPMKARVENWDSASRAKLLLQEYSFGGYVPGCAFETGETMRSFDGRLEGGYVVFEIPTPGVGLYLLRLEQLDQGVRSELAEASFEVLTTPRPGALTLNGGPVYKSNTSFRASVDDERLFTPGSTLWVETIHHGVMAEGGATSQAGVTTRLQIEHPKEPIEIPAGEPGSWEARLLRCAGECAVIDNAQYLVKDPSSPFALGAGLGAIDLRNDLTVPGDPWPGVGEFLTSETCKPWEVPPEKLRLSIATLEDGKVVPVKGPVDWGHGIFVEGRLEHPARRTAYRVTIVGPDGTKRSVTLSQTDDPRVVRSELMYFIWDGQGVKNAGSG